MHCGVRREESYARLGGRAGWERTGGPLDGVGAEDELHGAAVGKDIVIGEPVLLPGPAIDLQALHIDVGVTIAVTAGAGDDQLLISAEVDG